MAARLERPRNRRPSAKQNNLTNATVGNEGSRVKARGGRGLKRVIAGTCVGKVDIPAGSAACGFKFRVSSFESVGKGAKVRKLSVLFKRAILGVLARSSFAGGFKEDFGAWVMCPDLSFMCPSMLG